MANTTELYEQITDRIVRSLETCGQWSRPWIDCGLDASAPKNLDGRAYRGINTLLLWGQSIDKGYQSGRWGTYKAIQAAGGQVRKGEKGTAVILWKPVPKKTQDDEQAGNYLLMRTFTVFAAEQQDGWELPAAPILTPTERDERADRFFDRIGADVTYGGDRAYYSPTSDRITVPGIDAFHTTDGFYSTLAHEHAHWTGHKDRCDRDLSGRFGDASYAMEELVAELCAAFTVCALGITPEAREDHASYIKTWLRVLKDDPKAVVTAASKAQKAADYLASLAGDREEVTV